MWRKVRMMRQAMLPRLAIRTFENTPCSAAVSDSGDRRIAGGDDDPDGCWIETVAGIVDLRAVRYDRHQIHLRVQIHVHSPSRDAVDDSQCAIGFDRDIHEPVDVGYDIAFA